MTVVTFGLSLDTQNELSSYKLVGSDFLLTPNSLSGKSSEWLLVQ